MNESHKPDPQSKRSKKAYTTPQLIEYGAVEKLTASGSAATGDAAMMMSMCL
jgi:hypothetical protein